MKGSTGACERNEFISRQADTSSMESPDSPREDQVATVAGNLMGAAVMLLLL